MSETTKKACPNDTNGDGDCGRPLCPHCAPIGRDAPSDSYPNEDWRARYDGLVTKLALHAHRGTLASFVADLLAATRPPHPEQGV